MTSRNAPLAILSFKAGTLHAVFPDCVKRPGIYGTIMNPIELLDTLTIKDGINTETVRLAAQFSMLQADINKLIKEGKKILLSSNLTFSFK